MTNHDKKSVGTSTGTEDSDRKTKNTGIIGIISFRDDKTHFYQCQPVHTSVFSSHCENNSEG